MPFDYEEYERKCKTLPPEALQKEWENYTRQIAGGATSASLSVLFAPITAGVSTVGIGISAPRIHNARKKREIIEAQLQAHGTTHHTRKRDVIAPMAISGGLGGLTLGLAGPGADMIAGAAVGHGVEYVVSHVALETVGATLEHGHVTHKKTKEELKLAQKYGVSYESKERLEDAMCYGFDPQKYPLQTEPQYQSIPVPPPYSASQLNQQITPQYQASSMPEQLQNPASIPQQEQARPNDGKLNEYIAIAQKQEEASRKQTSSLQTQPIQAEIHIGKHQKVENHDKPQNGHFFGLPDDSEAEERGLHWDATRGMYVREEHMNPHPMSSVEQLPPLQGHPAEMQHMTPQLLTDTPQMSKEAGHLPLLPQTLVDKSNGQTEIQKIDSTHEEQFAQLQQFFPPPPPMPSTGNSNGTLLSPSGNSQGQVLLPLNGQSADPPALPPRPHSSLENFEYIPGPPPRPHSSLHNHPDQLPYPLPPPPPRLQPQGYQEKTPQVQYHAPVPVRPQQIPLAQYSPQQYAPFPSHPPYQQFLPPPPVNLQYQPRENYLQRPNPHPLQPQHRDSISSISTVSSCSSIFSSASTVSAATTPLTSYSTTTQSFYNPSPSRKDDSAGLGVCLSPPQQYPPPPPITGSTASISGKHSDYSGHLNLQVPIRGQAQGWNKVPAALTTTSANEPNYGPPPPLPNIY